MPISTYPICLQAGQFDWFTLPTGVSIGRGDTGVFDHLMHGSDIIFIVACGFLLSLLSPSCATVDEWGRLAEQLNGHGGEEEDVLRKAISRITNNWSFHSETFWEKLDETGAEYLFTKLTGRSISSFDEGKGDTGQLSKIGHGMRRGDWKVMGDSVCKILVHALDLMAETRYIKRDCMHHYFDLLRRRSVRLVTAKGIPAAWVKEDGSKLAKTLAEADSSHYVDESGERTSKTLVIQQVSKETLSALFSAHEVEAERKKSRYCHHFPLSLINNLTKEQRLILESPCFVALNGDHSGTDIKTISQLPADILRSYNGDLSLETLKRITPKQLAFYAADFKGDSSSSKPRCYNLTLGAVNPDAMVEIEASCLIGYWKRAKDDELAPEIGKGLKRVPGSTFGGWKLAEYGALLHVSAADWGRLPVEAVQGLISSPEALERFNESRWNPVKEIPNLLDPLVAKSLVVDSASFAKLAQAAPSLAGQVLALSESLPRDILSRCEPAALKGLMGTVGTGNKRMTVEGLQFLVSLKGRPDMREMISVMGDLATEHVCSTFITLDDYLEAMGALRPWVGEKCKRSLPFNATSTAIIQVPELAKDPVALSERLIKERDPTAASWNKVDLIQWEVLVEMTAFCRAFARQAKGQEIIAGLDPPHLRAIDAIAAYEWRKLLTTSLVSRLGDGALAFFDGKAFQDLALTLSQVSPSQLPLISSRLAESEDAKQHVFASLKESELKALDDFRLALITARQWSVVPPAVLAGGLKSHQLAALAPEVLTLFSDQQLAALSVEHLLALTAKQILSLGRERSHCKLTALVKVESQLGPAQKDALKERLEEMKKKTATSDESSSGEGHLILKIALILVVAIAIIGVAIFIGMRFVSPKPSPV